MTIDTVDKLDEMRARAIAKSMYGSEDRMDHDGCSWGDIWASAEHYADCCWNAWLPQAKSIRAADEAAGVAVIPIEHDARRPIMIGEYRLPVIMLDEDGKEGAHNFYITWDVIKEIVSGAIKSSPFSKG